jgi:hypothetical protein
LGTVCKRLSSSNVKIFVYLKCGAYIFYGIVSSNSIFFSAGKVHLNYILEVYYLILLLKCSLKNKSLVIRLFASFNLKPYFIELSNVPSSLLSGLVLFRFVCG